MSEPEFGGKPSIVTRFFGDLFQMAGWQKVTLGLAALIGGTGVAGQTYHRFGTSSSQSVETRPDSTTPPDHTPNFVDPAIAPPAQKEPDPTATTDGSFFQRNSPAMTRIGLSFVAAYIIGWAFRVFIKAMLLVTVLGGGLLLGLSYFNVVNVDLSAAREKYTDSIAWVTDQAGRLKDAALAHLPASGSGMMGLFVGLRKK